MAEYINLAASLEAQTVRTREILERIAAENRGAQKLANLIAAAEAALAELRPTENGFPRNAHCARSRLREAIAAARNTPAVPATADTAEILRRLRPDTRRHRPQCVTMWTLDSSMLIRLTPNGAKS